MRLSPPPRTLHLPAPSFSLGGPAAAPKEPTPHRAAPQRYQQGPGPGPNPRRSPAPARARGKAPSPLRLPRALPTHLSGPARPRFPAAPPSPGPPPVRPGQRPCAPSLGGSGGFQFKAPERTGALPAAAASRRPELGERGQPQPAGASRRARGAGRWGSGGTLGARGGSRVLAAMPARNAGYRVQGLSCGLFGVLRVGAGSQ